MGLSFLDTPIKNFLCKNKCEEKGEGIKSFVWKSITFDGTLHLAHGRIKEYRLL